MAQWPASSSTLELKNLPWTGHGDLLGLGVADDAGRSWSASNDEPDLDDLSTFTLDVVVPRMSDDQPRLARTDRAAAVVLKTLSFAEGYRYRGRCHRKGR